VAAFAVLVQVYDSSGALVRSFSPKPSDHPILAPIAPSQAWDPYLNGLTVSDGDWQMSFDGKNQQGSFLANGVYLMEITTSTGSGSSKVKVFFTVLSQPQPVHSIAVGPNPVLPGQEQVVITWRPALAGELRIYGEGGDLVRSFGSDAVPPLVWDLRTSSGQLASSGVYFVAVRSPGQRNSLVFKLALAR
jgi:hypothetical protein